MITMARIPMDLDGLAQFERGGFEGVAVYAVPMDGEVFEVAIRRLPVTSHTAPTEPARAATITETGDVVLRMWVALTACVGRSPSRAGSWTRRGGTGE
jgi:hypothetical protein